MRSFGVNTAPALRITSCLGKIRGFWVFCCNQAVENGEGFFSTVQMRFHRWAALSLLFGADVDIQNEPRRNTNVSLSKIILVGYY